MRWEVNTLATSMSGEVTETLEHDRRKAMVNVTRLDDRTSVVSLSLVVASRRADPRAIGEALLDHTAWRAVPKEPADAD